MTTYILYDTVNGEKIIFECGVTRELVENVLKHPELVLLKPLSRAELLELRNKLIGQ